MQKAENAFSKPRYRTDPILRNIQCLYQKVLLIERAGFEAGRERT